MGRKDRKARRERIGVRKEMGNRWVEKEEERIKN